MEEQREGHTGMQGIKKWNKVGEILRYEITPH